MGPLSKPASDLIFRNVTLHMGGQSQNGTLYLQQHHFIFSYVPEPSTANDSGKGTGIVGSGTAAQPIDISTGANEAARADEKVASGKGDVSKSPQTKARPKDLWVPYPLINSCILRPSHSQVYNTARASAEHTYAHPAAENDELFPPVFGTASYGRPSTDSARLASQSSPQRPSSPALQAVHPSFVPETGRQPAIRIQRKDFQMMALHFHQASSEMSSDDCARQAFFTLRSRCCVHKVKDLHAFHFAPRKEETTAGRIEYDARREYARMGVGEKAADGPGATWRISDINRDYSYSPTYPSVLCVPSTVSDNTLKHGGAFRSRSRIPCLTYLHSNGGSISRASQPMVGVQNKRNPQDERLVSAIFSSHAQPLQSPADSPRQSSMLASPTTTAQNSSTSEPTAVENEVLGSRLLHDDIGVDAKVDPAVNTPPRKIYGSTRRNLIVDARPKINVLANRATGGGIEDVANYSGTSEVPVEKVFLNIANIHVMRTSLDKVVESLENSDYVSMKPNQEALRKSGWLVHIAGLLEGSEMVARVVGLSGSHVLIHCSDGWDRTSQVAALAQVMLDPHCRTLNGFLNLIQKDFLSFGHKFRERNGIKGSEKWFEIENERISPSTRAHEGHKDLSGLNALGSKALTGARSWFEKNRGSLFRHQNSSRESLTENHSRQSSPPPKGTNDAPSFLPTKDENSPRMSEKEMAPIFHQFLDAVYQLQHQNPDAFEFNERFLRRLFYHAYSCQYAEFLFNTEKDRLRHKDEAPSVLSHFLCRRAEFVNADYVAQVGDPLLFPRHRNIDREVEVRWWSGLFHCKDEDMNVPRALARPEPIPRASTPTYSAPSSYVDDMGSPPAVPERPDFPSSSSRTGSLREAKSVQSLASARQSFTTSLSSLASRSQDGESGLSLLSIVPPTGAIERAPHADHAPSPVPEADEDADVVETPSTALSADVRSDGGDPLGVGSSSGSSIAASQPSSVAASRAPSAGSRTPSAPSRAPSSSGRLDFAAFAAQNAYQDR